MSRFLFLLIVSSLYACQSAKLSDAETKQHIGEYFGAAAAYRKVYAKTSPEDRDLRGYIAYRMAECERLANHTAKAANAYRNAIRYRYPDSVVYLRMGQMLQKTGRYAEAIHFYGIYLGHTPESSPARNGILGCESAGEWRKRPTRYQVRRMDALNSRRGEFGPILTGDKHDQLYFASSRTRDKEARINAITGQNDNNLFRARQNGNGAWLSPEELADEVNTRFDEGTPSFSPDGKTMYYTYCAHDPESPRTSEIRISTRGDAQWGKGVRAAIVSDPATGLGHPAVSPDGKYIYLVSDAIAGYGGKDLFRARIRGNEFGPTENLGPEINTAGDELFPYVRDSATLYFASDGHPGMGGLDLLKATLGNDGRWEVENLKAPVNSTADDFGITFAGREEKGFLSSNRDDARGYDHIYSFELPAIRVGIEGIVSDTDEYPVADATLHIVGKDGLNTRIPVRKDGSYRTELERDTRYVMMAGAGGYLNQHYELMTGPEEKDETYIVDFFLSPTSKPVVIEQIFYDFDKATLRPESRKALDEMIRMLNDNPHITIELGAHTDRKGSAEYNGRLAQCRAKAVVDYLKGEGIDPSRLEAKGYGESVPKEIDKRLARSSGFLKEGDILSEAFIRTLPPGRQEAADRINRRTEFRVLRTNYNLF